MFFNIRNFIILLVLSTGLLTSCDIALQQEQIRVIHWNDLQLPRETSGSLAPLGRRLLVKTWLNVRRWYTAGLAQPHITDSQQKKIHESCLDCPKILEIISDVSNTNGLKTSDLQKKFKLNSLGDVNYFCKEIKNTLGKIGNLHRWYTDRLVQLYYDDIHLTTIQCQYADILTEDVLEPYELSAQAIDSYEDLVKKDIFIGKKEYNKFHKIRRNFESAITDIDDGEGFWYAPFLNEKDILLLSRVVQETSNTPKLSGKYLIRFKIHSNPPF
jgi:hypothetical protein